MKTKIIKTATPQEQKQMGVNKKTNIHEYIELPLPEDSICELAEKAWELGFVGMVLKTTNGLYANGQKKIVKYETDFMTVEFKQ